MRALRAHETGGPEYLVEEDAPVPVAGIGDVLVRVHAASFTPTELEWPSTWVDRAGRDRRPVIPGHEVSGEVTALGYGTTGIAAGDAVYGLTDWYRDGTAAEYVAVEARNLARKPDRLDHRIAAAAPMVALTSQQALFDIGQLQSGQTVAVLGAGGGVGTFAVQLARAAGARVIALARPWACDLLRELGAEVFVDVDRAPLAEVDLVFDLVGGETLRRSCVALKRAARWSRWWRSARRCRPAGEALSSWSSRAAFSCWSSESESPRASSIPWSARPGRSATGALRSRPSGEAASRAKPSCS